MGNLQKARATLNIEVHVECPHCGYLIDLLDQNDTDGHYHNEDGHVLAQACSDEIWVDAHRGFSVEDVTCSECKNEFDVQGMDW